MVGKTALIFLHGSGSSGADLKSYLQSIPLEPFGFKTFRQVAHEFDIELITYTSDYQPYSPSGGTYCNVWFDRSPNFIDAGMDDLEDTRGCDASMSKVLQQIKQIEADYDHIFLGGFSMGGGLALHALRRDVSLKFRGLFALGSYLVNESAVNLQPLGSARRLPVIMMHGEADALIGCKWGKQTATNLLLRDIDVQFRSYAGVDHEISEQQLIELLDWLKDVLRSAQHQSEEKSSSISSSTSTAAVDSKGCKGSKGAKYDHRETSTSSASAKGVRDYAESEVEVESEVEAAAAAAALSVSAAALRLENTAADAPASERESVLLDYAAQAQKEVTRMAQRSTTSATVVNTGSSSSSSSSSSGDVSLLNSAVTEEQRVEMKIPYTLQYIQDTAASASSDKDNNSNNNNNASTVVYTGIPRVVIKFQVPKQYVSTLTSRPVLACGSMFEVEADPPNGVKTVLNSSDPHKTAYEIGRRLQFRLTSGSSSLNPCAMN